jgi:hypothetical protein
MDINAHNVGTWQNWRFGLITREVYRINKNLFEINDFSSGWHSVTVTKETLFKLYNGQKCLLTLNWS